MTAWELHKSNWSDCQRCPLWETRGSVVLARGSVPCDVLFVGEAPGVSEDALGLPFIGPAGKLQDRIISRALRGQHSYVLTNLISCIPLDAETGRKTEEPDDDSVRACSPRLREFVEIAKPKLIVCVGKLAETWLDPKLVHNVGIDRTIPRIAQRHPAAILRAPFAHQGLLTQTAVVAISNALDNLDELREQQRALYSKLPEMKKIIEGGRSRRSPSSIYRGPISDLPPPGDGGRYGGEISF